MFSNETLLSIAAKLGNMEIFRYLVKHGAPISPVGAKFSPLFAGIRQNNLEIVSTMLSLGADPNQFMLNKNNKPYYPLDVAISKGFNQAVALLITFGANTSLVNQKRIKDQNIKNMLNNMALPNITVDNKPYKEIETLKSRFDKFKKEILSFVQKIISKPGVSLETVENILNKIRKLFSDSIQFMCDLQPIANEINEMSRPLLNRQLEIYNIWSKQPPSPTSSQIYRLNDGRKIPDELESEWNQNRIKLVEQALTIHAYTHLAAKAFTQIDNLRNESIEYINDSMHELTEEKECLSADKTSPTLLVRIGIPPKAAEIIAKNSVERIKIIDETIKCLQEYKLKCDELGGNIIKCLRESAK